MVTTWNESMRCGVLEVDSQHKELFRQVDGLHRAMSQGEGRKEIGRLLEFLGRYVVQHFAAEERKMDELACPAAATNRQAHAEFLKVFKDLRNRFDRSRRLSHTCSRNQEHAFPLACRPYQSHRHETERVCECRTRFRMRNGIRSGCAVSYTICCQVPLVPMLQSVQEALDMMCTFQTTAGQVRGRRDLGGVILGGSLSPARCAFTTWTTRCLQGRVPVAAKLSDVISVGND